MKGTCLFVALSSGNLLVRAGTPAAPMIIAPVLHALRMLQAAELAWKMALAGIFIWVNAIAGNIWAWRVVKFVYALPYFMLCYLAGAICIWDLSPQTGVEVCDGTVAAFLRGSWLSEWWRRR